MRLISYRHLIGCRMQFDLANREAMDESAEWRLKYDREVERGNKCASELIQVIN